MRVLASRALACSAPNSAAGKVPRRRSLDGLCGRCFPRARAQPPPEDARFTLERAARKLRTILLEDVARRFAPYQGKVTSFRPGAEVIPGITSLAAPGHTPGHTIFRIADGNEADDSATDAGAVYAIAFTTDWTGATDDDWTDASNWSDGVPNPSVAAIIPDAATTPNDPVIAVGGQTCNTLWIGSGGTLDVSAGADSLGAYGGAIVDGPVTGTGAS